MKKFILETKLNEELKGKMIHLFENADKYMSAHSKEAKDARIIYVPVELTFNNDESRIVRVGLVNDLYFENDKDLNKVYAEYDNEEFNQFDENGVIEGLIPMNLNNDKCIIFMPAIYTPKNQDGEGESAIFLGYNLFFK